MTLLTETDHLMAEFDPSQLDDGIRDFVVTLRSNGVETYESCQGGEGHAYPEPAIRFFGPPAAGFHALSVALTFGLPVNELKRVWSIQDGEPCGPNWEMTFRRSAR